MIKTNPGLNNKLRVLVTGGSGFLGRAIVQEFLDVDSPVEVAEVRILDISDYNGGRDDRIRYIKGDICNYNDISSACEGIDIVIHAAAIVDWGTKSEKEVFRTNFTGTQNVIKACKENGVNIMVYTSSLDVVITGTPLRDIDESQPYPERHLNMYCESKCLSEKLVLAGNSELFKTCALRPSDIYGEGDPYHVPPLINMAKGGFYVHIGNGSTKNQHVYVRNMAWAHVLAAKALVEENLEVPGNAYFITDGQGYNFFTFFDEIITRSGYKIWPRNLRVPRRLAFSLGTISEYFAMLVRPLKYYNPRLSRFAVMYTSTDFTFSSRKAQQDFAFTPKYAKAEALENTVRYFKRHKGIKA
jgi:sterol-4alpha-carboxylate 3-dehydrogenase (decarboxylating)